MFLAFLFELRKGVVGDGWMLDMENRDCSDKAW